VGGWARLERVCGGSRLRRPRLHAYVRSGRSTVRATSCFFRTRQPPMIGPAEPSRTLVARRTADALLSAMNALRDIRQAPLDFDLVRELRAIRGGL
jgi:hypothetical protein